MTDSGITFSMIAVPGRSGRAWSDLARSAEQAGWSTLLVPDTRWTASPFPALAAAGAVTSTLRLRTWVIAAPLRAPAVVVREAAALQVLTDGRFELGIGSGRPDAKDDAAAIGVDWGTARTRIEQAARVITAVREQVKPGPQIVVAAAGPKMLAATAPLVDRLALVLPPTATAADLMTTADRARAAAGRQVSLTQQIVGLNDQLPAWIRQSGGPDARSLVAAGAVGMLTGDAAQMADTLIERSRALGIDEFAVPVDLAELFEPVLTLLTR